MTKKGRVFQFARKGTEIKRGKDIILPFNNIKL